MTGQRTGTSGVVRNGLSVHRQGEGQGCTKACRGMRSQAGVSEDSRLSDGQIQEEN